MTAFYNEIDPHAAQWLRNLIKEGHIADGIVDERSIEDIAPADLEGFTQCHFFAGIGLWSLALRRAGWDDSRPIWTGSCPCQPFSSAGQGDEFDDERHLWPAWHWLINECRPPKILGEQVASIGGLRWFSLVSADLEGSGYGVGAADLCAAGFGAFHIRQRLWFVAHADNAGPQRRLILPERAGERALGLGGLGGFGVADADSLGRGEVGVLGSGQIVGADRVGAATELARDGGIGGLVNSTGTGPLPGPHTGIHRGEEGSGSRDVEPERLCSAGRMAHADSGQRHGVAEVGGGHVSDGAQTGRDQGDGESELRGAANFWMEHASGQRRLERGTKPVGRGVVGGCGEGGVVNTNGDGRTPGYSLRPDAAQQNAQHDGGVIWHPCRDGKYRPIPTELAFFPLAHGNSGRVGKLRAYGNGIHVETATAWCRVALGLA